jgi:hypothetical protein
MTDYKVREEFSYSYSREIDGLNMLLSYGMAFDNNPYCPVIIPTTNLIRELGRDDQLMRLCMKFGCLDTHVHAIMDFQLN